MNMDVQMKKREQVSALVDGQLDGAAWTAALQCAAEDGDGRECWHAYHVIGDVLRSRDLGACAHDSAFVARLSARLQAEAMVAPSGVALENAPELIADYSQATPGLAENSQKHEKEGISAANDSSFRWKMLAGVASLAAVTAIGWNALNHLEDAPVGARLAQSGSAAPLVTSGASAVPVVEAGTTIPGTLVMVRDPRLDELLAAHRQLGGTSAFQNPSGFLRNATFEGGVR